MSEQRPIESETLVGSAEMVAQVARLLHHDQQDGNTLDLAGLLRAVQVLVANREACLCTIADTERTDFYRSVGFKATRLYRRQETQHDAWEMTWDPRNGVST
jgi:hypothetical protein